MQEYFARSLVKGMVHGEVVPYSDALGSIRTRLSEPGQRNLLIAFHEVPDLQTFLRMVKTPGAAGFIIPDCSPYSHLAWAISYFNAPTIIFDVNALEERHKTIYLDLDQSAILIPESSTEEQFLQHEEAIRLATARSILTRALLPATTKSGFHIEVLTQLQSVDDVIMARDNGADGVGEIKTEILLPADTLHDAIYRIVQAIRSHTQWRSIPIRFFDFAPDKPPFESTFTAPQDAFGYRGIRMLEVDQSLTQKFSQVLEGIDVEDIVVVLPMVTLPAEVEQFRGRFGDFVPKVGVEIETPAAALSVDELLELCKYLVIGTNDLTQFTMAWDRTVAHQDRLPPNRLSDPVAKLVRKVIRAARNKQAFSSLALDLWPGDELVNQILKLQVQAITVSPRLIPVWKEKIRLAE